MAAITDSTNPTIVMGTHITHPAPGSTDRPSFSSLVGNVDSNVVKYSASMRVELSRGDMIDGLEEMAKEILNEYISYRIAIEKVVDASPKRLILYRAGISEGQFAHVIKQEVPRLKTACAALNISPKITVIAVNKRTHVRLFSLNDQNTTRSGNCPVGTVVDTDVTHPAQFDFFLLSHADGLGTSRPSRYSVLYDENNFNADDIQSLTYALCHIYARSTRSVSVPAPLYCIHFCKVLCSFMTTDILPRRLCRYWSHTKPLRPRGPAHTLL
jgi:eukaryotic translation initiation factor 2C